MCLAVFLIYSKNLKAPRLTTAEDVHNLEVSLETPNNVSVAIELSEHSNPELEGLPLGENTQRQIVAGVAEI